LWRRWHPASLEKRCSAERRQAPNGSNACATTIVDETRERPLRSVIGCIISVTIHSYFPYSCYQSLLVSPTSLPQPPIRPTSHCPPRIFSTTPATRTPSQIDQKSICSLKRNPEPDPGCDKRQDAGFDSSPKESRPMMRCCCKVGDASAHTVGKQKLYQCRRPWGKRHTVQREGPRDKKKIHMQALSKAEERERKQKPSLKMLARLHNARSLARSLSQ
jgi:hypothetical protein